MTINYKIQIHSYWHCGSGLAAGADMDSLVIKDSNNLPYIPGKTIKGLVREACDEILALSDYKDMEQDYLRLFGYLDSDTKEEKKNTEMKKSEAFFTNATLTDKDDIVTNKLQRFMYTSIAQTAIGKDGASKEHCLRKIQIVVPCALEGQIIDVPESMTETVLKALKFIKNLGTNRNRGLGRCTIEGKETK